MRTAFATVEIRWGVILFIQRMSPFTIFDRQV